jgi:hypothetical protein
MMGNNKKKQIAAIIVSGMSKKPEEHKESEYGGSEMDLHAAIKKLMSAFECKDVEIAAKAFMEAQSIAQSMNCEEKEEVKEEEAPSISGNPYNPRS